jgi:tRNA threonylcarbamoyl adenosine modification protein (Sua5/YciO/YrdC/YwlC family)
MTEILYIHPETPQPRLIRQAVDVIRNGGLIAYPTDTTYALGCGIGEKNALDRLIRLRQLDKKHQFTLLCHDLSALAIYAKVENPDYRLLKSHTPGPYTFILKGTTEVPRRLMDPKKTQYWYSRAGSPHLPGIVGRAWRADHDVHLPSAQRRISAH